MQNWQILAKIFTEYIGCGETKMEWELSGKKKYELACKEELIKIPKI